jgi:opacity protein-like surface antigen
LGLNIVLPQYIRVSHAYQYQDDLTETLFQMQISTGSLNSGLQGSLGGAFKLPFMLVATQVNFRSPVTAELDEKNDRAYWKIGASAGLEVPIPKIGTFLRAGYSWNELDNMPYKTVWNDGFLSREPQFESTNNGSHTLSGGLGVLIKDFLVIDVGYSYSMKNYLVHDRDWVNAIREDHETHRVQCSFSFHY